MPLRAIDGVKAMTRLGHCFIDWIDDSVGSSLAGLHPLHAGQGLRMSVQSCLEDLAYYAGIRWLNLWHGTGPVWYCPIKVIPAFRNSKDSSAGLEARDKASSMVQSTLYKAIIEVNDNLFPYYSLSGWIIALLWHRLLWAIACASFRDADKSTLMRIMALCGFCIVGIFIALSQVSWRHVLAIGSSSSTDFSFLSLT